MHWPGWLAPRSHRHRPTLCLSQRRASEGGRRRQAQRHNHGPHVASDASATLERLACSSTAGPFLHETPSALASPKACCRPRAVIVQCTVVKCNSRRRTAQRGNAGRRPAVPPVLWRGDRSDDWLGSPVLRSSQRKHLGQTSRQTRGGGSPRAK